jgi:hypothetical protein
VKASSVVKVIGLAVLVIGVSTLVLLKLLSTPGKSLAWDQGRGEHQTRARQRKATGDDNFDVVTLSKSLPQNATPEQRSRFLSNLDLSVAELSEENLVELIRAYKSTDDVSEQILLSRLLRALYSIDPNQALESYAGTKIALGGLGVGMLEDAIKNDKSAFVKWMMDRKLEDLQGDVLQSFCVVLGRCRVDEATGILKKQNSETGARMAAMIFQNFGGTIEEAKHLAKTLEEPAKSDAVMGIVRRYQKKFPEQCYELIASEVASNPGSRPMDELTYSSLFKSLFALDAEGSIVKLEAVDVVRLQKLLSDKDVLIEAIKSNPAKTIGLLSRIIPTKSNSKMFSDAVNFLGQAEPKATLEWLLSMPGGESDLRSGLVMRSVELWAQNDADAAREAYLELPQGERNRAIEGLAKADALRWKRDSAVGLEWAKKLSQSEYSTYIRTASEFIAAQDPKAASDMLFNASREGIDPEDLKLASSEIGRNYANRLGVKSALEWVSEVPLATQPMAVKGVIEHWMRADPEAASEWISKQAAGPTRDAAVHVLIEQIQDSDPALAEQWKQTLFQQSNGQK